MNGIFTISLDFELHWGGFEKWRISDVSNLNGSPDMSAYFVNTRRAIPLMLNAFRQAEVHATWATVGLLFCENRHALDQLVPIDKPGYHQQMLSAYHYLESQGIGADEESDPFHFGLSLIRQIGQTPGMEVASHTFSHFYTCEPGQTPNQFRADLQAARNAARRAGFDVRSLVMPRNQINSHYLSICREEGFESVRVNPRDWFWEILPNQPVPLWHRLNRTADAYVPLGMQKSFALKSVSCSDNEPWLIPASRFLRPYRPKHLFLNNLRLRRIKEEMTAAARLGEVYHLWWHPHNFGGYPEKSMAGLQDILNHFKALKKEYGMQSCTMAELVSLRESL